MSYISEQIIFLSIIAFKTYNAFPYMANLSTFSSIIFIIVFSYISEINYYSLIFLFDFYIKSDTHLKSEFVKSVSV
jgi:hypothetical protein